MLNCTSHKATDERDRVYSLLGLLLHDGHRVIEVDYSDTIENLTRRTTIYLLHTGLGPELLYKCVGSQTKALSWTINLSQSPSYDWLNGLMVVGQSCEYFHACGSSSFREQPGKDDSCLLTDAVILDRVTDMSPRNKNIQELQASGKDSTDWILSLFPWIDTLKKSAWVDEAFDEMDMWRVMTADMDLNCSRYDVDADISMLLEGVVTTLKIRAALFADQTSQSDPIVQLTQMVQLIKSFDNDEFDGVLNQNQIELPDLPDETLLSVQPYMGHVHAVAGGRRLGITESGMMALLPSDTQKDDHLAIICSAPIPIVLRKTGDGFRIVGSCYIHYMMDGQALGSHLWPPMEITLY